MTERIALMADSTCDLPDALLQSAGIVRVPQSVFFGDREYLDGEELTPGAFYRLLAESPHFPTTSQPSLGRFTAAFEKLKQAGFTHVLCLTISGKLSGLWQGAVNASHLVSGLRIEVVDSRTVTWGLGILTLYAQSLIAQGLGFDELLARVRAQVPHTRIFFFLDSLDALVRGGRIGRARAFFGKCLGIRPVLTVSGAVGSIEAVAKCRSLEETYDLGLRLVRSHIQARGLAMGVAVVYSARPVHNAALLQRLQADPAFGTRFWEGQIGAVVGAHIGAHGWGLALL